VFTVISILCQLATVSTVAAAVILLVDRSMFQSKYGFLLWQSNISILV